MHQLSSTAAKCSRSQHWLRHHKLPAAKAPKSALTVTAAAAVAGRVSLDSGLVLDRIKQQFDGRAAGYDQDNTYHPPLAQKLLSMCCLAPGQKVLDLAAGTGMVALTAAGAVGSGGLVVAVDLSPAMLEQARRKADAEGLSEEVFQTVVGDMEQLSSCLPGAWMGTFDVMTCSAAVPFLRDPQAALAGWRGWLRQGGRLVFNAFVPPAIEDFGTFLNLAPQFGYYGECDPCDLLGSVELVTEAVTAAGYSSVKVVSEDKERWMAAGSVEEHAERIWRMALTANPFRVNGNTGVEQASGSEEWRAFHEAFVAAVVGDVMANGRWDEKEKRVLNKYTVLHVLAQN